MEPHPASMIGEPEPLNFSLSPDATDYSLDLFRKAVPGQIRTREMLRLLHAQPRERCLDLSDGDAAASYWLTRSGGDWDCLASTDSGVTARNRFLPARAALFKGLPLPFPDKTFDVAVVGDRMMRLQEAPRLVTELHRVLKPAGSLVLDVAHARPFSWLRPLQRRLPGFYGGGRFHPGFSDKALFRLLKDGFDVQEVRSYSRIFLTLVDLLLQQAVQRARIRSDSARRIRRSYAVAYPFFLAAAWVDPLLIGSRGYRLAVLAKRHIWRPRQSPVIRGNRPVSRAVLSTVRR